MRRVDADGELDAVLKERDPDKGMRVEDREIRPCLVLVVGEAAVGGGE